MPIEKDISTNLHKFDKKKVCHQELLVMFKVKDVWA
jgi:hypothetical protein